MGGKQRWTKEFGCEQRRTIYYYCAMCKGKHFLVSFRDELDLIFFLQVTDGNWNLLILPLHTLNWTFQHSIWSQNMVKTVYYLKFLILFIGKNYECMSFKYNQQMLWQMHTLKKYL